MGSRASTSVTELVTTRMSSASAAASHSVSSGVRRTSLDRPSQSSTRVPLTRRPPSRPCRRLARRPGRDRRRPLARGAASRSQAEAARQVLRLSFRWSPSKPSHRPRRLRGPSVEGARGPDPRPFTAVPDRILAEARGHLACQDLFRSVLGILTDSDPVCIFWRTLRPSRPVGLPFRGARCADGAPTGLFGGIKCMSASSWPWRPLALTSAHPAPCANNWTRYSKKRAGRHFS